jgi:glutamate N-acetyltransferase/amino-acid N-acetyltransferase
MNTRSRGECSKQRPYTFKSPSKTPAEALPRGFRFAATACGLKKSGALDLALIASRMPATAAAVFTTNRVQAAPVVLSREHLRRAAHRMCGIVVNSGNANCCTGAAGLAAAKETAQQAAQALGCRAEQVAVCSTGVIGVPLRVERILAALPELARKRVATPAAWSQVTRAIMTTDTRPKWAAASVRIGGRRVHLLGCAKGAGMIHPQMATMLAFVLTDAAIAPALLRRMLRHVADRTFNCISVDGDTSTNDTLAVLANGASGATIGTHLAAALGGRSFSSDIHQTSRKGALAPEARDSLRFTAALEQVCRSLALQIVADAEGAQRVVEIEVRGAPSDAAARRVAQTIATSPLVKTALAGADPNWGRILAAAGRSRVRFHPERTNIRLAGIKVFSRGRPLDFDERVAHRRMLANFVPIVVDFGVPSAGRERRVAGHARMWTCDFTADYVRINASYRT